MGCVKAQKGPSEEIDASSFRGDGFCLFCSFSVLVYSHRSQASLQSSLILLSQTCSYVRDLNLNCNTVEPQRVQL